MEPPRSFSERDFIQDVLLLTFIMSEADPRSASDIINLLPSLNIFDVVPYIINVRDDIKDVKAGKQIYNVGSH
jgi:hypothetical protein